MLPLLPFLHTIRDDIPLGVRDYRRIAAALQGDGPWTIERLRDTLLALLVKNPDQQGLFLRRFAAFFPAGTEAALGDDEIARVLANLRGLTDRKSVV